MAAVFFDAYRDGILRLKITEISRLLAELFSYSHETELNLFKSLYKKKIKHFSPVSLNSTFIYRDDVLSINKTYFHFYVDSMYPMSLK